MKRREFYLSDEERFVVEWCWGKTWITCISRIVLTDKPVIIGPSPLSAKQVSELTQIFAEIGEMYRQSHRK